MYTEPITYVSYNGIHLNAGDNLDVIVDVPIYITCTTLGAYPEAAILYWNDPSDSISFVSYNESNITPNVEKNEAFDVTETFEVSCYREVAPYITVNCAGETPFGVYSSPDVNLNLSGKSQIFCRYHILILKKSHIIMVLN